MSIIKSISSYLDQSNCEFNLYHFCNIPLIMYRLSGNFMNKGWKRKK